MAYYDIVDAAGVDFICVVRDHAKRTVSEMLVRAASEHLARQAFRGERSFSLIAIRAK